MTETPSAAEWADHRSDGGEIYEQAMADVVRLAPSNLAKALDVYGWAECHRRFMERTPSE